jgi:hypothetical protein
MKLDISLTSNLTIRCYQRFGFEVVEEETTIGVGNWFMRPPQIE